MSMELLRKVDIVRSVPKRWAAQYRGTDNVQHAEITAKLLALEPGFAADEVDSIIGNGSWTECRCVECGRDRDVLIRIGDEPDYEARYVNICEKCLKEALHAISA